MKTAIVIYQAEQIDELKKVRSAYSNSYVVALGADIELELTKADIPFKSAEKLRRTRAFERLELALKLARGILTSPELSFFSHRGVPLGDVHVLALEQYIAVYLYYLDILLALATDERPELIVVLGSHRIPFTGDVLATTTEQAVADAAAHAGQAHGVKVVVTRAPGALIRQLQKALFLTKRRLNALALGSVNRYVALVRPPLPLRLIISDVWRNVGPYLKKLPEAEVVWWERSEARTIPWAEILAHRIRFMHADAFFRRSHARIGRRRGREFAGARDRAQIPLIESAQFRGVTLTAMLRTAVAEIIKGGAGDVCDVENTFAMLEYFRPHAVLLRASVSVQTHFAFLAHVARALRIPSIEVQHGLLYFGPGSFATYPAAEYIATYGAGMREEYARFGIAGDRLLPVGSPRFDTYAHVLPAPASEEIVYVVSTINPGWWLDTYDMRATFGVLAKAAEESGTSITMALRSDSPYLPFLAEIIKHSPGLAIAREPLPKLLARARLVCAGFTTVLVEAALVGRSVVYDASIPMYKAMADHATFTKLTLSRVENADDLVRAIQSPPAPLELANFFEEGGAAERLAEEVRRLSRNS
jgi:hypothetical protein